MFALADKCHGWQRKGGPVMTRNTWPLSFRKSTVVASIRVRGGQPFLRGFYDPLRYEPCPQFINVSQKALHIYFIDGCRVCPLDARYKNRTKQPLVLASSHRGIPFYFCMARNSQVNISSSRTAAESRAWGRAPVCRPAYRTSARIWTGD